MRKGEFPERWKRAKLVLIPKETKANQELPKARPICLINDIGKGFKRILVERINRWMEDKEGIISRNQYGFRKGRSTTDALLRVKEKVEEVMREGRTMMAVSLDVENAFNSIPWGKIRLMMKRKKFLPYLRRMLYSYFKDRTIEYVTKESREKKMEVVRGVPQGSVLGLLLWILVYDRVLKMEREEGCEIIGYADDTIILVEENTYEEAKIKASMQTERVIQEIRSLRLKVATEKTEVIVFYGRRGKRPLEEDSMRIERTEIKIGRRMKYLGVILDSGLKFEEHFRYVEEKVAKVKRALGRLMPNLRGPSEGKRRLYGNIVQLVVMYGAPVWADNFIRNRMIQRPILRIQRYMAIRIIAGYRTVSYEVATVLARFPPWTLTAEKSKNIYMRIREAKREDKWDIEEDKKIRNEEEDRLYKKWKRRMKEEDAPGKEIRTAIGCNFKEWINRKDRGPNYHLTQMLTSHGCFNTYLERIQKRNGAVFALRRPEE